MHLRLAKPEDYYFVHDFYWNLIDEMWDKNDTVGWKKGIYPTDQYLMESIESNQLYVIDGKNNLTACVILNSEWNEGYDGLPWSVDCPKENIWAVHALGVSPAFHGKGIGKIVVQDIIDLAKSAGIKTIRLDALNGNTAAKNLYTSMGFQFVQLKRMFYEDTGWTEFVMYEYVL